MKLEGSSPHLAEPATCPCTEPDHSSPCPYPTSWRSILIFSSCVPGYSKWSPSLMFPDQNLYMPLLCPIRATCLAHLIHFITWTILGEAYRSISSSLFSFLHYPVTLSLLGPNVLLSTLFSNILSLHSSLSLSNEVSYPYKTTVKIMVLYIGIFIFLDSKLEDKRFCIKW